MSSAQAAPPIKLDRDVFVALAAVAWADGKIAPEEATALSRAARACGLRGEDLEKVEASTESPVDLDDLGELDLAHEAKLFVYALATWMAESDGIVVDDERATLAKLGELLELSDLDVELATATRLDPAATTADLNELASFIEADAKEARDSALPEAPLPPGSRGWPVIGETLSFVRDAFGFVNDRVGWYGNVFRTRVLGRDVVIITGPEACELWVDENRLTREGAMFDHVFALFGGASLPALDGDAHRERKAQVLAGFDRTAVEMYMPGLQKTIGDALDLWADGDEIRWVDALRKLAIGGIAHNMLGLEDPESLEGLVADYAAVTGGFAAIPVSVPGSAMHRAKQARDRLMDFMRDCVAESRSTPRKDGLSRILAAKGPDGSTIEDEDAALELHHIFLAGYIVFAQLAGLVIRLEQNADVREAVIAEVQEHAAEGDVTVKKLAKMRLLGRVTQEVKRITPILPIIFAKAKRRFTFKGVTIPEGWQVSLALHQSHILDGIYPDPLEFDPGRFGEERAEHQAHDHAFAPQGPGPMSGHKCAGNDYATYFMMTFAVLLLRDYVWELPSQTLDYDFSHLPPEPRDGLRARLSRRS